MKSAALIVAAGRGSRLGAEIPKQYIPLDGRSALRRSVELFLGVPGVTRVLVVIHADDRALYEDAMQGLVDPKLVPPVLGGETRAASVLAGLDALASDAPDNVLIHDAARPFMPANVISEVIDALTQAEGACAALPVVDALWSARGAVAETSVPRHNLWRAQTPQGFRFGPILKAHRSHDGSGADDVAVAREAGMEVRFVPGAEAGYKITTADDLARAISDAERLRTSQAPT